MPRKQPKKRRAPKDAPAGDSPQQSRRNEKTPGDARLSNERGQRGSVSSAERQGDSDSQIEPQDSTDSDQRPAVWLRNALSVWVTIHLALVALSFSGVVSPSGVQTTLLDVAKPYLEPTHFAASGRPYYLAHGTNDEQPHRLQVTTKRKENWYDGADWVTMEPIGTAGLAANDRYARWMATVATLAEQEQPSLVAQLLLPLLEADETITAVRVVRLPTELTTTEDDALPPPYLARVSRVEGKVSLVQLLSPRLVTMETQNQSPRARDPSEADPSASSGDEVSAEEQIGGPRDE